MAKIERFEDIEAWKLARKQVLELYIAAKEGRFAKDYGFKDQILRAAVSVMANISEGFERFSKKGFAQFLNIARASSGEVRSHLYIAFDLDYISEEQFEVFKNQSESISRHIWNFMKYLKNSSKA